MKYNQGENATEKHGVTARRWPRSFWIRTACSGGRHTEEKGRGSAPGPAKMSSCARRLREDRAHAYRTAHDGALHRNHTAAEPLAQAIELHVTPPSKREFAESRRCRGPNCKAPLVELHARVGRAACPWAESAREPAEPPPSPFHV